MLPIALSYALFHLSTIIITDYRAFLALGPGGTPATPQGYLRIKFLSLFALRDPYSPLNPPTAHSLRGKLAASLPPRTGPRPIVKGIAPHRQRNQHASPEAFAALRAGIEAIASKQSRLRMRTSCLEKHGPGLFVVPNGCWGEMTLRQRCGGEVCHAHPSDGSLHLTLHPADAATVLNRKWGELHPLARGGWLTRFVPQRFLMVYAPRDAEELDVVLEIIRAAVSWVGGIEVDGKDKGLGDVDWDVDVLEAQMLKMGTARCLGEGMRV